jgi:hypothetical protein
MYYQRFDVRTAILNFAKGGLSGGVRESAIYNSRFRSVQRYIGENGSRRPIDLNTSDFDNLLGEGGSAFYCSYWYYDSADFAQPIGRDLVWTVRAKRGGLRVAKFTTRLVLDALREVGVEPWVKYSGDLGFDIIIPLETIPQEIWMGSLETLDDIHRGLTAHIASHIREHLPEAEVKVIRASVIVKIEHDVCLLSELRVRRGLLLAPMSLNPETNLASVPVDPASLESFSVLDATPENIKSHHWASPTVNPGLLRFVRFPQLSVEAELTST